MRLTFLGATGTVTGSKYLLEVAGRRVLVDCGLFQGVKAWRLRNRDRFHVDPSEIDAVVLTHAHLDHTGYLPLLVKNGFRGPVYATSATRDLCGLLLPDSGHLQEEEAETANRYGYSKHHPAVPLYTEEDAIRCLQFFEEMKFHQSVSILPEIEVFLTRSGHMLGSAFIHLKWAKGDILFSGDLGRPEDPLLPPPEQPEGADYLVVESTYGDRLHKPVDPADVLASVVSRTAARGGAVIIPAFAVGRAQTILLHLEQLARERRIPRIPIYIDSPMASRASTIFEAHHSETRLDAEAAKRIFDFAEAVETVSESKSIDRANIPRVIISASGMATGGRVVHHLKALASDARNTILFAGYQAAGTRGATIVGGAEEVRIHGAFVPIKAEVVSLDNISAHADYSEILQWMGSLRRKPRTTFITHGEPQAADALRVRIESSLGWEAVVPEYKQQVDL